MERKRFRPAKSESPFLPGWISLYRKIRPGEWGALRTDMYIWEVLYNVWKMPVC